MKQFFYQLFGWLDFAGATKKELIEDIQIISLFLWLLSMIGYEVFDFKNIFILSTIFSSLFFIFPGIIGITIILLKEYYVPSFSARGFQAVPTRGVKVIILGAFMTIFGFGMAILLVILTLFKK